MDLGEKIKTLRIQQGLTLEEVGERVGVGKSTVRKWESGQIANMRRDKIALVAKALCVSPAYLMGWTDEMNSEEEKPAPKDELSIRELPEDEVEFFTILSQLSPENRQLLLANAKVYLQAQGAPHDSQD